MISAQLDLRHAKHRPVDVRAKLFTPDSSVRETLDSWAVLCRHPVQAPLLHRLVANVQGSRHVLKRTKVLDCAGQAIHGRHGNASFSSMQENQAVTQGFLVDSLRAMSIHRRIKERRKALGLSMQALALAVGVRSWQTIQQWEREDGTEPRRKTLTKVAHALGVSEAWLMWGDAPAVMHAREPSATYTPGPPAIGDLRQLVQDWESLPEGWRFYICHKAHELSQVARALPDFVKQSIKPIPDNGRYRQWERELDDAIAKGELLSVTGEWKAPEPRADSPAPESARNARRKPAL